MTDENANTQTTSAAAPTHSVLSEVKNFVIDLEHRAARAVLDASHAAAVASLDAEKEAKALALDAETDIEALFARIRNVAVKV
jgi:hypothetical protein